MYENPSSGNHADTCRQTDRWTDRRDKDNSCVSLFMQTHLKHYWHNTDSKLIITSQATTVVSRHNTNVSGK